MHSRIAGRLSRGSGYQSSFPDGHFLEIYLDCNGPILLHRGVDATVFPRKRFVNSTGNVNLDLAFSDHHFSSLAAAIVCLPPRPADALPDLRNLDRHIVKQPAYLAKLPGWVTACSKRQDHEGVLDLVGEEELVHWALRSGLKRRTNARKVLVGARHVFKGTARHHS